MANHEQKVICEFLALLKTNPNALSSVLQTTQLQAAITSNEQTDALNSSSTSSRSTSSSPTSDKESAQNTGAVDIVSTGTTAYSAEDLLAKRGAKGKGSKAQQTFRVSPILIIYSAIYYNLRQPNFERSWNRFIFLVFFYSYILHVRILYK